MMVRTCWSLSVGVALATAVALVAVSTAGAQPRANKLEPVETLDLERYLGQWYELGRYPNRFQKKCTGDVVAVYSRRPDGLIEVKNSCATAKGPTVALGVARQANPEGPASVLQVRFAPAWLSFLPVWGDYWVIDLAPDYTTAVVGTPDRNYLWILSRSSHVDMPTWSRLVDAARRQGYDVSRIERTPQREQ
jgi:apolipoprotein D and lipocalin family protein